MCSRCKERPTIKNQRYCLSCKAEYMREWRKKKQDNATKDHDSRADCSIYITINIEKLIFKQK